MSDQVKDVDVEAMYARGGMGYAEARARVRAERAYTVWRTKAHRPQHTLPALHQRLEVLLERAERVCRAATVRRLLYLYDVVDAKYQAILRDVLDVDVLN